MCGSAQSKQKIELEKVEKEEFNTLLEEKEDPDPFTAARISHGNSDYALITTPGQNFDPVIKKINTEENFRRVVGGRVYKKFGIPFSEDVIEIFFDVDLERKFDKKKKSSFVIFEKMGLENIEEIEKKFKIQRQKIETVHKIFDTPPKGTPSIKNEATIYKDPKFPPETSSIIQNSLYNSSKPPLITSQMDRRLILALRYVSTFFWESPINSKIPFKIFDDKPLENTIHQGLFLNDYFLAALGSLSCHDYRLAKKLVTAGGRDNMEYVGFSFNRKGKWECVWVDTYLPFFKKEYKFKKNEELVYRRTKFLGAQCKENEIWVALYEKAYAKFMGSYFNIAYGGVAAEVMSDLTGAPSIMKKIRTDYKDDEELWQEILKSYQLGYMICCDSGSSENAIQNYKELYKKFKEKKKDRGEKINRNYFMKKGLGLVDLHTYSVMGLAVIKGEKLIKLRNVWGRTEWLGKWGDGSKEWLEKHTNEVEHKHQNDGIFYMPFEDFYKLFSKVHFCYYEDEYVFSNLQIDVGKGGEFFCFDIEVQKKGFYFIEISQGSYQNYELEKTKDGVQYAPLSLFVTKDNGIVNQLVAGKKEAERDIWIKAELATGVYQVYIRAEFGSDYKDTVIGLTTYGPKVTEISLAKGTKNPEFSLSYSLNKALSTLIYNHNEEMFKPFNRETFKNLEYICLLKSSLGFGILALKNTSFNKKFSIEIFNKKIFYPKKQNKSGNFEVILSPGENIVISWDSFNFDENLDLTINKDVIEEIDYHSTINNSIGEVEEEIYKINS